MLDLGVVQAVGVHRKWERKGSVHSAESLCISCPMPHWGPCAASQHFNPRVEEKAEWPAGGVEGMGCFVCFLSLFHTYFLVQMVSCTLDVLLKE